MTANPEGRPPIHQSQPRECSVSLPVNPVPTCSPGSSPFPPLGAPFFPPLFPSRFPLSAHIAGAIVGRYAFFPVCGRLLFSPELYWVPLSPPTDPGPHARSPAGWVAAIPSPKQRADTAASIERTLTTTWVERGGASLRSAQVEGECRGCRSAPFAPLGKNEGRFHLSSAD